MGDFNNYIPAGNSKEDIMRAFIGSNADYYLKYYKKLQQTGKKFSWNWSACIFSPVWFYARKMYLLGFISTFTIMLFSQGTNLLVKYMQNPNIVSMALPWTIAFFAFMIALGALGNFFYVSHVESKVIFPGEDGINKEDAAKLNMIRGGLTLSSIINAMVLTYFASTVVQMLIEML
ncbi:hypothetical protein lbkm_1733 [Lachnospiraceae bacterium KM106-2]|nr:hypothetical protein lbkm_1733 [Lachnospiraceae bacterium KM106-2]